MYRVLWLAACAYEFLCGCPITRRIQCMGDFAATSGGGKLQDYYHLKGGGNATGLVGPNLTHFGSRKQIAGGVLPWDPASCVVVTGSDGQPKIENPGSCGLYQWLHDPQAVKPGNDMNIRTLSDTEIAQLI